MTLGTAPRKWCVCTVAPPDSDIMCMGSDFQGPEVSACHPGMDKSVPWLWRLKRDEMGTGTLLEETIPDIWRLDVAWQLGCCQTKWSNCAATNNEMVTLTGSGRDVEIY